MPITRSQFISRADRLFTDASTLGAKAPSRYRRLKLSAIAPDPTTLLPAIARKDWTKVRTKCRAKLSDIRTQEQRLSQLQREHVRLLERLHGLRSGFEEHYEAPTAGPDWLEARQKAIDDVRARGGDSQEVSAYLDRVGSKNGLNAYNHFWNELDTSGAWLQYVTERTLAARLYYYTAEVIARYNTHPLNKPAPSGGVVARVRALDKEASRQQARIKSLLKAGKHPELATHLKEQARWLTRTIDQDVVPLLAHCHAKKAEADHASVMHGRRAMAAGSLLQTLLRDLGGCLLLARIVSSHVDSKWFRDYSEKAATLADAPPPWPGDVASLEELLRDPTANHGREVVVQGIVSDLKLRHLSATKVVSTANLRGANGDVLAIVLPYIKLDSGGMVNRSYARVAGKFVKRHAEAGAAPAVAIARWPLEELAATSWPAWLRFQLRNIIAVPSHSLIAEFSLERGVRGAVNPVVFEVTAAEPEFPELGR